MLFACVAFAASAEAKPKVKATKPLGITKNPGGDVIMAGKVKIIASSCPSGSYTKLQSFQAVSADYSRIQVSWSGSKEPLAVDTMGFIAPAALSKLYTAGTATRIVFVVRCVDPKKQCVVNVDGLFSCNTGGKESTAGFLANAQVNYDKMEEQVDRYKSISPTSLLEHTADIDTSSAARQAIRKLKSKALEANN